MSEVREGEHERGEEVGGDEGGGEAQSTEVREEGAAKLATVVSCVRVERAVRRLLCRGIIVLRIVFCDRVDVAEDGGEKRRRAEVVSRDRFLESAADGKEKCQRRSSSD